MKTVKLRGYQASAIIDIAKLFGSVDRVLLQLPTGAGKTELAFELARHVIANDVGVVWFVVHRVELLEQTAQRFRDHDVEPSFIAAGYKYTRDNPIQICSIQTLVRRLDSVKLPSLVIVDEAHHSSANAYEQLDEYIGLYADSKVFKIRKLGLTATPRRLDRKALSKSFDVMVEGPTVQDLIDGGFLAQPEIFVPPKSVNLIESWRDHWHTQAGDYKVKEVEKDFSGQGGQEIYGDAIEHYLKFANGERALVFCTSIRHCQEVAAAFNNAGIPSEPIDGTMKPKDRSAILKRLETGVTLAVMSCNLVSEGFNCPAVSVVIMLRPTQSLCMYLQMCGRPLRVFAGKVTAKIFDHVNNVALHGPPWIKRFWTLEGYGAKTKTLNGVNYKLCPRCGIYLVSGDKLCGNCQYSFPVAATAAGPKPKKIAGELVRLTPTQVLQREMRKMMKTYDEFLTYANTNGKRGLDGTAEGWAKWAYQQKLADDQIYFNGDAAALTAMFTKQKRGTPETIAKLVASTLAKRTTAAETGVATTQDYIFSKGTFAEIVAYARQQGKDDPDKFARAVFGRRFKTVYDTGTREQVLAVVNMMGITGDGAGRYADAIIAGRTGAVPTAPVAQPAQPAPVAVAFAPIAQQSQPIDLKVEFEKLVKGATDLGMVSPHIVAAEALIKRHAPLLTSVGQVFEIVNPTPVPTAPLGLEPGPVPSAFQAPVTAGPTASPYPPAITNAAPTERLDKGDPRNFAALVEWAQKKEMDDPAKFALNHIIKNNTVIQTSSNVNEIAAVLKQLPIGVVSAPEKFAEAIIRQRTIIPV